MLRWFIKVLSSLTIARSRQRIISRKRSPMLFSQKKDDRSMLARLFFNDEGDVNRRNIFLLIFLLVLLGNCDRVIK